jgi:uncharacterized membrane protein (UPF0127 family)
MSLLVDRPLAIENAFIMKHKLRLPIVVSLLVSIIGCSAPKQSSVSFGGHRFLVELATTLEQRARGLMYRQHLDEDKGMLFIFEDEEVHPFWMKNTYIPLDMIWIDKNRKVVFISKNTPPSTDEPYRAINPRKKAKYVLELCGGTADKIGLDVGDKLTLDIN